MPSYMEHEHENDDRSRKASAQGSYCSKLDEHQSSMDKQHRNDAPHGRQANVAEPKDAVSLDNLLRKQHAILSPACEIMSPTKS